MEEFLETLKHADGDYWDEFLEKAKALHEEKFTLAKLTWGEMCVFQLYKNGWHTNSKERARSKAI